MINKLQLIYNYFVYLIVAVGRHGLQSSFMFNLFESVWKKDIVESDCLKIEQWRNDCLKNKTKIEITDFGAGFSGKILKHKDLSYIAKNSAKSPKYARMLYRLVKYLKPQTIIELGTSLGVSTQYMAAANNEAHIHTLEGCPQTMSWAKKGFEANGFNNITAVEGNFDSTLSSVLQSIDKIDMVFIDGNHKLHPTLNYFEQCLTKAHEHTWIIVDDINWSDEMKEAWNEIIKHPSVSISIDLFMMGIVFLNPAFSKQNFVVRY